MNNQRHKELSRRKRHGRIRLKISGTPERLRLVVRRSLANFYAQLVDDTTSKTLYSLSTLDKEIKQKFPYGGNVKAAEALGDLFAAKVKEKGITTVIFDRAGYLYHGRVKSFAEHLRKGGLDF